jgi:ER-bound oxygenase mpaB/B'/Rubber oxygenase, catalytic domain
MLPTPMSTPTATPESARIPGDFLYWENIDRASSRTLRRTLRLLFRADPKLPDAIVRRYAASYYDADPVAEAFVDEVYGARGQAEGRKLVDCALADGVDSVPDAPPSLRALFRETEVAPSWLDPRQVDLGARVFRGFGTHMFSFAGAITLEGYRESSVAKPLAFTGAYNGESAQRRFLETAAFWIDVASPGGLAAGGRGRATALRVRLMHVFVRRRLLAHPLWDLEAWGVPISQGDALLTLMGGSFVPGFGLRALGYRTSREEIEAMMHFWRYVGHLLGVQPRWYPESVEDGLGLMFTSQVKGARGSGEDGAELARSYLASYAPRGEEPIRERLRKRFEHGVQRGYVGWFVPARTRRYYGLPAPGAWRLAVPLQAPWVFARETVRRHVPRFDDWVDGRMRRETARWVAGRMGEKGAEYQAVERMTR